MACLWLSLSLGIIAVLASCGCGAVQLRSVERWDFEERNTRFDNWGCLRCSLQREGPAKTGSYGAKIIDREFDWSSAQIMSTVEPGKRYYFSLYFRMLSQLDGYLFHAVSLRVRFLKSNGVLIETKDIGVFTHEYKCDCFQQLSGDFLVPDNTATMEIRLFIPETEVDYLIDDAELFEVVPDENWREAADSAIAEQRHGQVVLSTAIASPYVASDYRLVVRQVDGAFPWGTAVRSKRFLGNSIEENNYKNFVLDNFKWATIENYVKWRQMEMERDNINYETIEECLEIFDANSINVRAHAIFFNKEASNPPWVAGEYGEDMKATLDRRLQGLVGRFSGRFQHWDVDNEYLPDTFYERRTGNRNIVEQMHYNTSQLDPNAKLFTNEYDILSRDGKYTQAYINALKDMMAAGVPIDGIGIQAHMKDGFDLTLLQRRLDAIADVGLPIWITELTVNEPDMATRAQGYEDMLILFYSHPAVEGVLIWGFWDGAHYDLTAVLAEGPDIKLNEAGERFFALLNQWRTHDVSYDGASNAAANTHVVETGTYVADLYEQGQLVLSKQFSVEAGSKLRVRSTVKNKSSGAKLMKIRFKLLS